MANRYRFIAWNVRKGEAEGRRATACYCGVETGWSLVANMADACVEKNTRLDCTLFEWLS